MIHAAREILKIVDVQVEGKPDPMKTYLTDPCDACINDRETCGINALYNLIDNSIDDFPD